MDFKGDNLYDIKYLSGFIIFLVTTLYMIHFDIFVNGIQKIPTSL